MKVSMNWIRQYADIPVSPAEYESRMIMTGTGVEGTEYLGGHLEKVVVGRVLTCVPHPDSDHLHICTVDVGEAEPLQIVCGAPNVEAGILVPVAKIGAALPGGTIKKGKLRGVESCGMLCSSDELGVPVELYPSVGSAGLLIFHEDYPLGADVKPILGLDDTVMDFEVLANRPDCLSVWGLARETAVACGTEFKKPEITVTEADGDVHDYVRVDVESVSGSSIVAIEGNTSVTSDDNGGCVMRRTRSKGLIMGYVSICTDSIKKCTVELPELKKGCTGNAVRSLQLLLNVLNFPCGVADGILGDNTEKGIKAFQSANGCVVDGIVGKDTYSKLFG